MAAKGKIEQASSRRVLALELRKSGCSYRIIGEKLGVSHVTALGDVHTALKAIAIIQDASAKDLLLLELARLDDMQLALAAAVRRGCLGSIEKTLKIMTRRSKYLGLDAPEKQERSGEVTINIVYSDD